MTQKFAASGGTDRVEFIAGYTIEEGLLHYAEEIQAGCIAVSTHSRKGFSHFFNGSISENVANQSILPVMSFKI
jgi:nucleotide-binding universal stress UspA family protein